MWEPQCANIPQIDARFDTLLPIHIGPSHGNKATGGEFGHHHIVLPLGAVTDQQISVSIPSHDEPHMGSPVVEGDIPRQGLGLGHLCQVGPNVPVSVAVQAGAAQAPVNQPRAVQTKGPVGAGGGIPGGGHLHQLAPPAVRQALPTLLLSGTKCSSGLSQARYSLLSIRCLLFNFLWVCGLIKSYKNFYGTVSKGQPTETYINRSKY